MNGYYEDRINLSTNLPYPVLLGVKAVDEQKAANDKIISEVESGNTSNITSFINDISAKISNKKTENSTLNTISDGVFNLITKVQELSQKTTEANRKAEIDAYLTALESVVEDMENRLDDQRRHKWLLFGGVNAACILLGVVLYNVLKK